MPKPKLNSKKSVRVPEPKSVLTRDQDIIVQAIAMIQAKYGRVHLYSDNVTYPTLFAVLFDLLKHSRFVSDIKLLVQCGILREELGGVYYFNNRLCACCSCCKLIQRPKPKPFPKSKVDAETRMDMLFKAQVLKERVESPDDSEYVIRAKKSKQRKPQNGKHAAKIANQMSKKMDTIRKIDGEIGKLETKRERVRERWVR